MRFTDDIVPVTDFRNNAADVLTQLITNGRPIVLTQRGRASAVLLDVKEYQRLTERIAELERIVHGGLVTAPGSAPLESSSTDDLLDTLSKALER